MIFSYPNMLKLSISLKIPRKYCINGIHSKNIIIQPSIPGRIRDLVTMDLIYPQVYPLLKYKLFTRVLIIKAHILVMIQVLTKYG